MARDRKWVTMFEPFIQSGEDSFAIPMEDVKTRNTFTAAVRSYLLGHKLYRKYYVVVERGSKVVQIRKF